MSGGCGVCGDCDAYDVICVGGDHDERESDGDGNAGVGVVCCCSP